MKDEEDIIQLNINQPTFKLILRCLEYCALQFSFVYSDSAANLLKELNKEENSTLEEINEDN